MKQCCTCKINKEISAFGNNKSTKDLLDAMCKDCRKIRNFTNKEKNAIIRKKYYDSNKDNILLKMKMDKNPNKLKRISEYNKQYRIKNLEKIGVQRRERYSKFPEKKLSNMAKRRAARINATPKWLTKEHLNLIENLYKKAKIMSVNNNKKYHVDHIIPLNSSLVCGLHVPWNLQILEARLNIIKGNKCESVQD